MAQTNLSSTQISQLTAIVTGGAAKRAASKAEAAKRFIAAATAAELGMPAEILAESFDDAREIIHRAMGSIAVGKFAAKEKAAAAPKQEAKVKPVKAAKTAPAATPKAAATVKAAPADKPKSKREIMLDLVCRKDGATEAEICEQIGWKACLVTLRRASVAAGINLRAEKVPGSRARYYGKRPQA